MLFGKGLVKAALKNHIIKEVGHTGDLIEVEDRLLPQHEIVTYCGRTIDLENAEKPKDVRDNNLCSECRENYYNEE